MRLRPQRCETNRKSLQFSSFRVSGQRAARGPPPQGNKPGWPCSSGSTSQQQTDPMQPWDKDRRAGRMVVALFDVGQPFGFARSHRAQSLRLEALRLFQHGAIEDSATRPLLGPATARFAHRLARPEKLIDLPGFPSLMVDEGAQPFRSSPFPQPVHGVCQFTRTASPWAWSRNDTIASTVCTRGRSGLLSTVTSNSGTNGSRK